MKTTRPETSTATCTAASILNCPEDRCLFITRHQSILLGTGWRFLWKSCQWFTWGIRIKKDKISQNQIYIFFIVKNSVFNPVLCLWWWELSLALVLIKGVWCSSYLWPLGGALVPECVQIETQILTDFYNQIKLILYLLKQYFNVAF